MDVDQWGVRNPLNKELNILRTEKYWAIRKLPRRFSRSISYDSAKSDSMKKISSQHRWKEFIKNLMTISTEAHSGGRLYDEYFSYKIDVINKDSSICTEFLDSKVSRSATWHKCNHPKKSTATSKWERITMNLIDVINIIWWHQNIDDMAIIEDRYQKVHSTVEIVTKFSAKNLNEIKVKITWNRANVWIKNWRKNYTTSCRSTQDLT